jgi:hypothetical protein
MRQIHVGFTPDARVTSANPTRRKGMLLMDPSVCLMSNHDIYIDMSMSIVLLSDILSYSLSDILSYIQLVHKKARQLDFSVVFLIGN